MLQQQKFTSVISSLRNCIKLLVHGKAVQLLTSTIQLKAAHTSFDEAYQCNVPNFCIGLVLYNDGYFDGYDPTINPGAG